MQIEIAQSAHDDIAAIYQWIAQDDRTAAVGVVTRLYQAIVDDIRLRSEKTYRDIWHLVTLEAVSVLRCGAHDASCRK